MRGLPLPTPTKATGYLLQLERQIMGAAAKTLQTSMDQVMDGYDLDLSDPDDLAFYTCISARANGMRLILDLTYK
jgi:hypothetical protein